jgi:hypothetical protein
MSNQINSITLSNQLQQARSLMAGLQNPDGSLMFRNFDKAILVQHTLRSEVILNATQTSFQIPILQNSAYGTNTTSVQPSTNLLSLQDVFCTTEINIGVAKASSSTDTTYQVFNYAPKDVFSTTNTAAAIIGMYSSGYLKFVNNQQIVAPYWDLQRHYLAPNQQPAANAYYTSSGVNYISQIDGSTDGFYPCQPMWVFNGGGNIQLSLNIPQNLAAVESNEKLVCWFRGFLLQNASLVK